MVTQNPGIRVTRLNPRGVQGEGGHVYLSQFRPAVDGTLPDSFTKRGIDVAITLDVEQMRSDIEMSVSARGVVLVPQAIDPGYIVRVVQLHDPRYTLYTRPTARAKQAAKKDHVTCHYCGMRHRLGMQWCVGGCWTPLTYQGIHNRIQLIWQGKGINARAREVELVYGFTLQLLYVFLKDPGASVNAIPTALRVGRDGQVGITDRETRPSDARKSPATCACNGGVQGLSCRRGTSSESCPTVGHWCQSQSQGGCSAGCAPCANPSTNQGGTLCAPHLRRNAPKE